MENKPKFEPGKEAGKPFKVKLEDTKPFKSGTSQYGEWHGYNVKVESQELTWFASASVKKIIDSSGVKANEEFILELRNFKDSSGNIKKAWYINGKTAWEYEDAQMQVSEPAKEESIDIKDVTPAPVKGPGITLEERVSALEKRMDECESKDEEKIPF